MQQGMEKQINLGGIVRNTTPSTCPDGEMEELINIRYKDGSFRPISDSEPVKGLEHIDVPYTNIVIHACGYRHWIGYKDGKIWYFADQDKDDNVEMKKQPIELCDALPNAKYSQAGHLLTKIDDSGIAYILFIDGEYRKQHIDYNGEIADDYIEPVGISFRIAEMQNGRKQQLIWEFYQDKPASGENKESKQWKWFIEKGEKELETAAHAAMNKGRSTILYEGHPIGGFWITAALQTFDGEYIMQTNPVFLFAGNDYGTTSDLYDINEFKYPEEGSNAVWNWQVMYKGQLMRRFWDDKENVIEESFVRERDYYGQPTKTATKSLGMPNYLIGWNMNRGLGGNYAVSANEYATSKLSDNNGSTPYIEYPHVYDNFNTSAFIQCHNIAEFGGKFAKMAWGTENTRQRSQCFVVPGYEKGKKEWWPKIIPAHKLPYYCLCCRRSRSTNVSVAGVANIQVNFDAGIRAAFPMNKIQYRIDKLFDLDESLFKSVDIFITEMIEPAKIEDNPVVFIPLEGMNDDIYSEAFNNKNEMLLDYGRHYFSFEYQPYSKKEYTKKIMGLKNFYLIKSFLISELKKTNGWVDLEIEKGILNNIHTQPELKLDAINRNSFLPKVAFSYNGRLHLANYQEKFFMGYPIKCFQDYRRLAESQKNIQGDSGTSFQKKYANEYASAHFSVYIKVDNRDIVSTRCLKIVQNDYDRATGLGFPLHPIFIYPDNRAYKLRITVCLKNQSRILSFDMKPHDTWNVAYAFLEKDIFALPKANGGCYSLLYANAYSHVEEQDSVMNQFLISRLENNMKLSDKPNYLKVSAVDNPLYFPYNNTYKIGNVEILALLSNNTDLSSGQIGDAPLYVFAKDGIWGLFVDASGSVVYSVSREIAVDILNNPQSVLSVLGGIIFTTERGLMLLQGSNVWEISESIEGKPLDFTNQSSIDFIPVAKNAASHERLVELVEYATDCEFKEYIRNAIIGYNYNENELWITNPSKPYTYIYIH